MPNDASAASAIRELLPSGVDVILDPAGTRNLDPDLTAAAPGAQVAPLAIPVAAPPAALPPPGRLIGGNVGTLGFSISSLSRTRPSAVGGALRRSLSLLADGAVRLDVTAVPSLETVSEVHDLMPHGAEAASASRGSPETPPAAVLEAALDTRASSHENWFNHTATQPIGVRVTELFPVLERPRSAVAGVEQHLKELIRARRLVAGDRLPAERELAERLGVNRSTLRSALQSLADQGVLMGRHGSGWTVEAQGHVVASNFAVYLQLEDVSFQHLFDARRAVEPAIAAGAAEHRTEDQVTAMRACIAAMRATTHGDSYVQADSDFHALIAAASGNPVFTLLISPTLNLLADVRRRIAGNPGVIAASHREHEMILAAIESGNPDAARDAMLTHISSFISRSATALSQQDS